MSSHYFKSVCWVLAAYDILRKPDVIDVLSLSVYGSAVEPDGMVSGSADCTESLPAEPVPNLAGQVGFFRTTGQYDP